MCLIIFAPASASIPQSYIDNAFTNNDDGAGVAYVANGEVVIEKGFFDVKDLHAALNRIGRDTPRLIHFRYATLGIVNEANCHPFKLEASASAMAHNGPCVHDDWAGDAKRSDSRHLAEDLMSKFDQDTLFKMKPVLNGFVNTGNKLAFLFADGSHLLINEHLGKWRKGLWLSNEYSIEPPVVRKSYGTWTSPHWSTTPASDIVSASWDSAPVNFNDDGEDLDEAIIHMHGVDYTFYYDWTEHDWYCYNLFQSIEELLPVMDKNSLADVRIVKCLDPQLRETLAEYGITQEAPPTPKAAVPPVSQRAKPRFKLKSVGGKNK